MSVTSDGTGGRPAKNSATAKTNGTGVYRAAYKARVFTWDSIEPEQIHATIVAVTNHGGAIVFGRTQDGGAGSLTVLDGNARGKHWPATDDEANEMLQFYQKDYWTT